MTNAMVELTGFIHKRRLVLGYTQETLPSMVRVTKASVSNWENGSRKPQAKLVPTLSMALRADPEQLASLIVAASR